MAVAALVLGILALVLCWMMFVNFILGVLGIIFGALGLARAKRIGGRGKGMALAGLITGILGIVIGGVLLVFFMFIAGDVVSTEMHRARNDLVKAQTMRLAREAYPSWAMEHPGKACPANVSELDDHTGSGVKDPWGHDFKILCGSTLPRGSVGLEVLSLGPDGVEGTDDDIKSWEH